MFVSWRPDQGATAADAFSIVWDRKLFFYVFPHFPLIHRCLQKITTDKAESAIIMVHSDLLLKVDVHVDSTAKTDCPTPIKAARYTRKCS